MSGALIALSLQTKFFTAFLIPIIALEIVYAKKRFLSPLLLWLGSLLAVYLAIVIIFFHLDFRMFIQQLFQPHLKQIIVPGDDFSTIWRMILTDYDIALLALVGIILLIRKKKWQLFFPVLWLVTALGILLKWQPIWSHYYLLISIPICWLAAISFSQFFTNIRNNKIQGLNKSKTDIFLRWITAVLIIVTIARLPLKCYRTAQNIGIGGRGRATPKEYAVVNLLWKHKKHAHWIFTDRPIFAFCADILVVPELLIISEKRNFATPDAQDYCINKLQEYRPELILLNNLKYYGPKVLSYIERNYTNIYQDKVSIKLYLRKDITDRQKL